MNLYKIANELTKHRLFRTPHYHKYQDEIDKLNNSHKFEGRYFTLNPESSVGYHPNDQFIEVEIPEEDVAIEDGFDFANMFIELTFSDEIEKERVDDAVEQARSFGVPDHLIDKLVHQVNNYKQLTNDAYKHGNIVNTLDGSMTKDMAQTLRDVFKHINKNEVGQVQLIDRQFTKDELVAVYTYDKESRVIEVTKINGEEPSFKLGELISKNFTRGNITYKKHDPNKRHDIDGIDTW
jgi:hypothetical protein